MCVTAWRKLLEKKKFFLLRADIVLSLVSAVRAAMQSVWLLTAGSSAVFRCSSGGEVQFCKKEAREPLRAAMTVDPDTIVNAGSAVFFLLCFF